MAWIFSLSAECGSDESSAKKFAQYFQQSPIELLWSFLDFNLYPCRVDTFQDIENNWWCRVSPNHISEMGIDSPNNPYLMEQLVRSLYSSLEFAPPFRYALVGVEVDEFRTYSELIEDLPNLSIPGLVLSTELTQGLETLSGFQEFSSGYIWQPYPDQMVSPELKNQPDEIFVS